MQIMQRQYESGVCCEEKQWTKSHHKYWRSGGQAVFCWGQLIPCDSSTNWVQVKKVQSLILTIVPEPHKTFFFVCGASEV